MRTLPVLGALAPYGPALRPNRFGATILIKDRNKVGLTDYTKAPASFTQTF